MIHTPLSLFDTREFDASPDALTDSDQRYTPQIELARVQRYLGAIGLDPCANPQRSVPALNHITEAQNCLTTDWAPLLNPVPTAFMNPPFSNTAPFLRRMAEYLRSLRLRSAVTLTLSGVLQNKSTQPLIKELAVAVCAPIGRINFVGARNESGNDRDVIWICWGIEADRDRFAQCFDGLVLHV